MEFVDYLGDETDCDYPFSADDEINELDEEYPGEEYKKSDCIDLEAYLEQNGIVDTDDCKEPDEIRIDKSEKNALVVPLLQSMTSYIKFHYKRTITASLCQWIEEGEGGIRVNGPNLQTFRDTLKIKMIDFWGASRTTLTADVYVSVETAFPGSVRRKTREYVDSMTFVIEDGIHLLEQEFTGDSDFRDREWMIPLSQYLIPYMNKPRIEKQAEEFLRHYNPDALADQNKNSAVGLARKLGLSITSLRLHDCDRTRSILFFRDSRVQVEVLNDKGKLDHIETVLVGRNTIVLNAKIVGCTSTTLDIYHECIHYEWHYMFFSLQDLYCNDLRKIRKKRKVLLRKGSYDRKNQNPLGWLEFQAKRGSFALWMPETLTRDDFRKRMSNPELRGLHRGQVYQYVAIKYADKYAIPKFRVRARLIQFGHWGAMGCLNYEDEHYVAPFSFEPEDEERDYTYFIRRKQFYELYCRDPKFRKLINSGQFIWADGHICLNRNEYIVRTNRGPVLTKKARERVDLCCLRFKDSYTQDETYTYRHGRLNSDDDFNEKFFYFPPMTYDQKHPKPDKEEQIKLNAVYRAKLPSGFPEQMTKLMEDCNFSAQKLADYTGISERAIYSYRSRYLACYSLDKLIAVIVAMQIPPWVSSGFLRAAGQNLAGNPALYSYECVVMTMFYDTLENVQRFLKVITLKRLDLESEDELENEA